MPGIVGNRKLLVQFPSPFPSFSNSGIKTLPAENSYYLTRKIIAVVSALWLVAQLSKRLLNSCVFQMDHT